MTRPSAVDGRPEASQGNTRSWSWPNRPLELGSSHDSYWKVFDGLLDDFQVHNRMLSAEEVAAAAAGNPVLDSSLVERLNFTAEPVNDVVVDFPFVPVIAITGRPQERQPSSSSLMVSIPREEKLRANWETGSIPGLRTIQSYETEF